jgi:hypothetical protein
MGCHEHLMKITDRINDGLHFKSLAEDFELAGIRKKSPEKLVRPTILSW